MASDPLGLGFFGEDEEEEEAARAASQAAIEEGGSPEDAEFAASQAIEDIRQQKQDQPQGEPFFGDQKEPLSEELLSAVQRINESIKRREERDFDRSSRKNQLRERINSLRLAGKASQADALESQAGSLGDDEDDSDLGKLLADLEREAVAEGREDLLPTIDAVAESQGFEKFIGGQPVSLQPQEAPTDDPLDIFDKEKPEPGSLPSPIRPEIEQPELQDPLSLFGDDVPTPVTETPELEPADLSSDEKPIQIPEVLSEDKEKTKDIIGQSQEEARRSQIPPGADPKDFFAEGKPFDPPVLKPGISREEARKLQTPEGGDPSGFVLAGRPITIPNIPVRINLQDFPEPSKKATKEPTIDTVENIPEFAKGAIRSGSLPIDKVKEVQGNLTIDPILGPKPGTEAAEFVDREGRNPTPPEMKVIEEREYSRALTEISKGAPVTPAQLREIEKSEAIDPNPIIDPVSAFVAGVGAGSVVHAGEGFANTAAKALITGSVNAAADIPIGVLTDEVTKIDPDYTLPALLTFSLISANTVELFAEKKLFNITDRLLKKAATTVPVTASKAVERELGLIERIMVPVAQSAPGVEKIKDAVIHEQGTLNRMNKLFTRFTQLDSDTTQAFINISEGQNQLLQKAGEAAVDITKDFDAPTLERVYQHLQEPLTVAAPGGAERLIDDLIRVKNWSFTEINGMALSPTEKAALRLSVDNGSGVPGKLKPKLLMPQWPENEIEGLKDRLLKLTLKSGSFVGPETQAKIDSDIAQAEKRLERLSGVEYFHQVTSPPGVSERLKGVRVGKGITKTPKRLLGRKFATRLEAQAAGRQVGTLQESVAETIFETNHRLTLNEFIKNINKNPEFSARADLAPRNWEAVDEKTFPSGKFRKYHPSIAEALREITWAPNRNAWQNAYHKLNTTGKILGFYNPLIMSRYNVTQGMRATGFSWPKGLPAAYKVWSEKGDIYWHLSKNGLFNNRFDLKPGLEDITKQLGDVIGKPSLSLTDTFKGMAKKALRPDQMIRSMWETLNETAWKIDEVQRINTYLQMLDNPRYGKHYSDFDIIQLANDFHANYSKIPAETREALNKGIFTPSYKISMARAVGRMHKEAPALWPSLLRHYGMKIFFNRYLPLAAGAYFAFTGQDKKARVDGYRVIVSGLKDKKETVYSISDPVLEAKKILNRPFNRTIEYNAASLPSVFLTLTRGPLFQGTGNRFTDTLNAFFKTGIPGKRELDLWQKTDIDSFQKFSQMIGTAFVYQRNQKEFTPPEKEHIATQLAKAMDLWADWSKVFPKQRKTITVPIPISGLPKAAKKFGDILPDETVETVREFYRERRGNKSGDIKTINSGIRSLMKDITEAAKDKDIGEEERQSRILSIYQSIGNAAKAGLNLLGKEQ